MAPTAHQNDPETMARLDWQASVKKGKTLAKAISRSSWALGDLALAMFPTADEGKQAIASEIGGEVRTLLDFADAIDMSPGVLRNLRYVSQQWPPHVRRANVSWSTHKALAAHPDRFTLIHDGMKRPEASALVDALRKASAPVVGTQAPGPVVPVERATIEARAALAFVTDKRRRIEGEAREELLTQALQLQEVVNELMAALTPAPVEDVAPRIRRRFLVKTAA